MFLLSNSKKQSSVRQNRTLTTVLKVCQVISKIATLMKRQNISDSEKCKERKLNFDSSGVCLLISPKYIHKGMTQVFLLPFSTHKILIWHNIKLRTQTWSSETMKRSRHSDTRADTKSPTLSQSQTLINDSLQLASDTQQWLRRFNI